MSDWSYSNRTSPFPRAGVTVYESVDRAKESAAADQSAEVFDGGVCLNCQVFRVRNVVLVIPTGIVPHPTAKQAHELEVELRELADSR